MAMSGEKVHVSIEAGPEIHPAVEAKNVQAREDAEIQRTRFVGSFEKMQALSDFYESKKRRKATRQLLICAALAVVVVVCLSLALKFDLISWPLVFAFDCCAMVWLAVWLGAWLQFMFCKEGVLK